MKSHVRKWGHSLAVRIPQAYAEQAGLCDGAPIEIRAQDGKLVIERPTYVLADLLSQVSDENLHEETDMGPPAGRETW